MKKTIFRMINLAALAAVAAIAAVGGCNNGVDTKSQKVNDFINMYKDDPTPPTTTATYTLTVNISPADGGTVSRDINAESYDDGTRVTVTAAPNSGYEFLGWSGLISSNELTVTVTMDRDKQLTAGFGRIGAKRFTVTFSDNGATINAMQADSGTAIPLPAMACKYCDNIAAEIGYYFDGWKKNNTGPGYDDNTYYIVTANDTLYAQWRMEYNKPECGVQYYGNGNTGGDVPAMPAVLCSCRGSAKTLDGQGNLVNTGYEFGGWNTEASGNGTTYQQGPSEYTGCGPLYAVWIKTYTVTVSSAGTDAAGGGSYAAGATVTISAGAAPSGQQFKNWTASDGVVTFDDANNVTTTFAMPANDVTVTANWQLYYESVTIGGKTWMKNNLNIMTADSWCYDNADSNCVKYGRLYTWNAANTVCPNGWHLPSRAEWDSLARAVEGTKGYSSESYYHHWYDAGKYLKSAIGWAAYSEIENLNTSGFSALPGGGWGYGGSFTDVGDFGIWWTAEEYFSGFAYNRSMGYNSDMVYEQYNGSGYGFSVRCVAD